jgi:hypothetical protein
MPDVIAASPLAADVGTSCSLFRGAGEGVAEVSGVVMIGANGRPLGEASALTLSACSTGAPFEICG